MIIKILIGILMAFVLLVGGFSISESVKYSYVVDLLGILQNTSAMIFAIAGIWLAYLYPNAIAGLMKSEKVDFLASKSEAKRIEGMILIIIMSATVLIFIIAFYAFNAVLRGTDFYANNRHLIKGVSCVYILSILLTQLSCVIVLIWRNVSFINRLYTVINEKELEEKL